NTFAPDEVSILGELEFSGGNNSVNLLRVSNTTGDGINISAGAVSIAYVLVDNSSGKAITLSTAAEAALNSITIYGNGYGLHDNSSGSVTMVNSIVWGNTTAIDGNPVVTYSDISSGYTGTGNIDSDPLFVDAANGDFHLGMLSPCIDAGDSSGIYDADSTVMDMGAFPRLRQFLAGTSDDNIRISADTTVILTEDFTVTTDDTMQLDAGAQLYFGPGVTLTVEGPLRANGNSGGVISFRPVNPDSTFGGVVIGSRGAFRESDTTYSYLLISGVEAASIPLTVYGSTTTLNHITIAGNGNAVSLSANDGGALNYSILEGTVTGTVSNTGSFTGSTDQFSNHSNGDFTLLATAVGIDTDTSNTDPDNSYADAGALYHDQSSYPVTSITVHRPAAGDTILVSPDTSAIVGLTSTVQLFNTYGRYKTNGVVNWNGSNTFGSFPTDSTNTTNPDGKVSNAYVTNTVSGSHNSFTITADGVSSTSGFYLVEQGIPDSVWVTEQTELNMAQLDSLTFTANIYDQFANLVRQGESATWSVNTVSGSGDGYSLSSAAATTDASGAVSVTLYTDPTGNSLSVGDQITVVATSNSGSHASAVVTIIPSDIYNLTLAEQYTSEQLNVSADTAYIDFYTTLIDTFDNPLENVEVFWEVVTGLGTGESLDSNSSHTNSTGVATVRLNTNTVADSTYQVRCWVTETSLLNAFGSFDALASAAVNNNYRNTAVSAPVRSASLGGIRGFTADNNRIISAETARHGPGQFVPVNINRQPTVNRNLNRNAIYDLDDTTAVVLVWPGVTASVSVPQADTDVLLDEQFSFTLDAYDQFNNLVRDNTPVSWEITPSSANVSIVSSDAATANGQATINLQVASNAVWDFSFTITATVEGVGAETGTYNIDDVIAPAAVSNLSIDPSVWTATNDFTFTWNNPGEHSGVAGAHYEISGESSVYVSGSDIQTLNFSLPVNDSRTVKLWLQDNAGNEDAANAMTVPAKWDNTSPDDFNLTKPLAAWYSDTQYRFEWNSSSDATAGLDHYAWSVNGGSETTISPDSTAYSYPTALSNGTYNWTVTAYDSAGNATETSNPQTIQVDHTVPSITHNPVLEATENTAVVINAVFTDGESGISTAELYYRRGGETNWQPPVDMTTLSTYQIASSYSTSLGMEYYLHAVDVAGNVTNKPAEGFTSVSVTITNGLASTDRWSTGIPNGT
ncbi:MAG: hypothetical protein VX789_00575, partial [Candidatus Neomarinimicrobiota bacterium]|nr:hypothetical protein [Candidatus Neomarinimicrobiota bacterium]